MNRVALRHVVLLVTTLIVLPEFGLAQDVSLAENEFRNLLWREHFKSRVIENPDLLIKFVEAAADKLLPSVSRALDREFVLPRSIPQALRLGIEVKRALSAPDRDRKVVVAVTANAAGLEELATSVYNGQTKPSHVGAAAVKRTLAETGGAIVPLHADWTELIKGLPQSEFSSKLGEVLASGQNVQSPFRNPTLLRNIVLAKFGTAEAIKDQLAVAFSQVDNLANNFKDSPAKYGDEMGRARSALALGSSLARLISAEDGEAIAKTGDALLQASSAVADIVENGLTAFATGNLVGAAFSVVGLLGGAKPDPTQKKILEAVEQIKKDIQEVNKKLGAIDRKLDAVQTHLDKIHADMQVSTASILQSLDQIREEISATRLVTTRGFIDILTVDYSSRRIECRNRDKSAKTCLDWAFEFGVNTAKTYSASATAGLTSIDISSFRNIKAIEEHFTLLDDIASYLHIGGIQPIAGNPRFWLVGLSDYIEYVTTLPNSNLDDTQVKAFKTAGEEYYNAILRLKQVRADSVALKRYNEALVKVRGALDALQDDFANEVKSTGITLRSKDRPWFAKIDLTESDTGRLLKDPMPILYQLNIAREMRLIQRTFDGSIIPPHQTQQVTGNSFVINVTQPKWTLQGCVYEHQGVNYNGIVVGDAIHRFCEAENVEERPPVKRTQGWHFWQSTRQDSAAAVERVIRDTPGLQLQDKHFYSYVTPQSPLAKAVSDAVAKALGIQREAFAKWLAVKMDQAEAQKLRELRSALRELDSAYVTLILTTKLFYGDCVPFDGVSTPTNGLYGALASDTFRSALAAGELPSFEPLNFTNWPLSSGEQKPELTTGCHPLPTFIQTGREWLASFEKLGFLH